MVSACFPGLLVNHVQVNSCFLFALSSAQKYDARNGRWYTSAWYVYTI